MKRLLSVLLAIAATCGCNRSALVEEELAHAAAIMEQRPDSALCVLRRIDSRDIVRRRTRAAYALLYTQALDKNYIDCDDDSLIRFAYRYYDRRKQSDSMRFAVNYGYGRIHQNAGEYDAAIPYYLQAERFAASDYSAGLTDTRLGEVYYEQMNYALMLEYDLRAYEHMKNVKPLYANRALLNIGNAYLSLQDYDNALKYFRAAYDSARSLDNAEIMSAALVDIGETYAADGDYDSVVKVLHKLPRGIESVYEYQLLISAYIYRGQIDSAKYYLEACRNIGADTRDDATLSYLAFQIALNEGDASEAEREISRYISTTDSLTRAVLAQSAVAAERRFYKEQSQFAAYKLRVRKYADLAIGAGVLCVVALLSYYYRRRVKRKQKEIDLYVSALDDMNRTKAALEESIREKQAEEQANIKTAMSAYFGLLDNFGRIIFERQNTEKFNEAVCREVKSYFDNLASDPASKHDLENIVNIAKNDAIAKLREQMPSFKQSDIDLLCYVFAGFSTQAISLLTGDSAANIYTRKSRLKTRVERSDAPDKKMLLDAFGK